MYPSLWQTWHSFPSFSPLTEDTHVDAAVIGGGLCGLLIAHRLQQSGLRVCVLERDRVAQATTAHTTAKITSQHGLLYADLIDAFGLSHAKQYADAQQRAIEQYAKLIADEQIDCSFERKTAYLYATHHIEPLKREWEAVQSLGLPAHWTANLSLPLSIEGAIGFDAQAQFDPLAFLRALVPHLPIYEQTCIHRIEPHRIHTPHGIVHCKSVIVATHFPLRNTPGYYFMRMHQQRSYALALTHAPRLEGMYIDIDPEGFSWRMQGTYLLFGGAGHRTGDHAPAGGMYDRLRVAAKQIMPKSEEAACWSAQDCMTLDRVPYIGPYAESMEDVYVATGFGKWGMTNSMVAADLIDGYIQGRPLPYADLFSPQRSSLSNGFKQLWGNGCHAVRGLAAQVLTGGQAELAALPIGHGGIVDINGQKAGVYKDEQGRIYSVSTKCPHMGCQVVWNPDEKTWDCPCHGSRFDPCGHVIDAPAVADLSPSVFDDEET